MGPDSYRRVPHSHASIESARLDRRLLVVQRNPFVARSLARYLGADFSKVDVAYDCAAAEVILADPSRTPTHLVCGQNFGTGEVSGSELCAKWRGRFPALERVVLATSELIAAGPLPGVDAVFHKPARPQRLLELLH